MDISVGATLDGRMDNRMKRRVSSEQLDLYSTKPTYTNRLFRSIQLGILRTEIDLVTHS